MLLLPTALTSNALQTQNISAWWKQGKHVVYTTIITDAAAAAAAATIIFGLLQHLHNFSECTFIQARCTFGC